MESDAKDLPACKRLEELRDGDYVVTPGGDISTMKKPDWYDAKKFNKAKEVYREYFACVNFSHLCGLLLSFYFTKNIKTLRSTGESESKTSLFHRYLLTIRHTQKWYEGDVWDVNDPAHKSLATVRAMHARVAKRMAERNDGVVYVSQWDMAVTQWAFVGPMVMFRSKVGLHGCTDEEYDSLIHFWRVIGYLLGIEDRYNLCDGTYDQVLTACKSLLEKEYRSRVKVADPSSVSMAKNVVTALSMIDILLTWESMAIFIHELVDVPCPVSMNWIDWVCNSLMRFVFLYVVQYETPRSLFNDLFRWRLDMADKKDLQLTKIAKKFISTNLKSG
ncbi:uncharacterized protein LOC129222067 [Uloborus diversus]|uniref:uncharacterized protein LOC129222067 n=1 Tax=Uloborus diversus TaxID=327109 RepID=UPI002409C436|nr:uncharacterized protein LOC129222067 [Uloborus diversus]